MEVIMKRLTVFLFLIIVTVIYPQELSKQSSYSIHSFSILGGTNFNDISSIGGNFLVEYNNKLLNNLYLNLSLGYNTTLQSVSFNVKTYNTGVINGTEYYWTDNYNITQNIYNMFPISAGIKYFFNSRGFLPYFLFDLTYNFINSTFIQTPGYSKMYNSFNNLPNEYMTRNMEALPNHSYGITFGAGTLVPLSSKINIDLRYVYKIDSKVINTNNVIVGISF